MDVIKVGNRYINLDQVTDVEVGEDNVTLFFAVPKPRDDSAVLRPDIASYEGMRWLRFAGDDKKTLLDLLEQRRRA